jgi:hypothetical protein
MENLNLKKEEILQVEAVRNGVEALIQDLKDGIDHETAMFELDALRGKLLRGLYYARQKQINIDLNEEQVFKLPDHQHVDGVQAEFRTTLTQTEFADVVGVPIEREMRRRFAAWEARMEAAWTAMNGRFRDNPAGSITGASLYNVAYGDFFVRAARGLVTEKDILSKPWSEQGTYRQLLDGAIEFRKITKEIMAEYREYGVIAFDYEDFWVRSWVDDRVLGVHADTFIKKVVGALDENVHGEAGTGKLEAAARTGRETLINRATERGTMGDIYHERVWHFKHPELEHQLWRDFGSGDAMSEMMEFFRKHTRQLELARRYGPQPREVMEAKLNKAAELDIKNIEQTAKEEGWAQHEIVKAKNKVRRKAAAAVRSIDFLTANNKSLRAGSTLGEIIRGTRFATQAALLSTVVPRWRTAWA